MSRRCERPDCAAPATVAYGFDAPARTAWYADLDVGRTGLARATAGALCRRHAAAMVLPRGWWLDDRRAEAEALLFAPSDLDHRDTSSTDDDAAPRRRRATPRHAAAEAAVQQDLDFTDATRVRDSERLVTDSASAERLASNDSATAERRLGERSPGERSRDKPSDTPDTPSDTPAPWTPAFDHSDDLDGLLDARSPLLARAFQGRRRSTPPARPSG